MELADWFSLYIRGVNLWCLSAISLRALVAEAPARGKPLATLLEVQRPVLKIVLHTLFKVSPTRLPVPLAPQIFGFHPFLKNFFAPTVRPRPPCAESPRRTPSQAKNRGIPRQNRPFTSRRRLKITRKTPLQTPESPTLHAPQHKKVE